MTSLTPLYFLDKLKAALTAPDAFSGYEVVVFEGLRSSISSEYTLQIYPTNLKEATRADNVIMCTDTWQIAGVVQVSEADCLRKTLAFIADTKSAIDKLEMEEGDFICALLPDLQLTYENSPYLVFNLQVEVRYDRRIK